MRNLNKFLAIATLCLSGASIASAAQFGYCTDDVSRDNIFRVGTAEKQGMAIKLTHDKVKMLKGCTISGVATAFGSSRTTDGNVEIFVSSDFDSTPLTSQVCKISGSVKWLDFTFDKPYVITGDENELYIGYTAAINSKSTMLMADYMNSSPGCSFVYSDTGWIDSETVGCGNVTLRAIVSDAPDVTDVTLKSVDMGGFLKANTSYSLKGQVFNFGSEPIKSFDLSVTVAGKDFVAAKYDGIDVAQGQNYDVEIERFISEAEGKQPFEIKVTNVNGGNDDDSSDNVFATEVFFYPEQMERSLLLEGFTGQTCSNCPSGHATLETFLETIDTPVIEVMHHAGYSPDYMTMDADMDYTYFYGNPSTYAPAVMLNRTTVNTVGSVPVMNVNTKNLESAYAYVNGAEPYVSLALCSKFDPVTREVKIDLCTYTHADLPGVKNVFNVMLVQDSIVSLQLPFGANYIHNGVFRGVLTGNSWGIVLPEAANTAGNIAVWQTSFVLPESIFADYYNWDSLSEKARQEYSLPTVPDNMRIVAFVGSYSDSDIDGHQVYNAVSTPLGKDYVQTGMSRQPEIAIDKAEVLNVRVIDRRIVVDGDFDAVSVYSIDGINVADDAVLSPGIYVVRASKGNAESVAKVLVK